MCLPQTKIIVHITLKKQQQQKTCLLRTHVQEKSKGQLLYSVNKHLKYLTQIQNYNCCSSVVFKETFSKLSLIEGMH